MSTQKDRAEQKRREKLQLIVTSSTAARLKIRQMTPVERRKHPPRPRPEKRGRG
jgi:hypothetical protein